MSPKATYRGVAYDTNNKGQTQIHHSGNQVYRGVEVDYSTYQQQSAATIRTATSHLSWC
jgi:hypothetical protein